MNSAHKVYALVCLAFIFAVASFQNKFAIYIGGTIVWISLGILAIVLLGAVLSLRRPMTGKKPMDLADTQSRANTGTDSSRPLS